MKYYHFKALYQKQGWLSPAFVGVDELGKISYLSTQKPEADKLIENIEGYALAGFQNAHSHAFQYAMAGIAENHGGKKNPDDFWSWREAMYQLALTVNPEQMEAIAAQLYAEMLRHGYTQVAEFHYLHHDFEGKPFANLAEMGERLLQAAQKTGIKITLIPIFYQKGNFGQAATARQRRFISPTLDDFLRLKEASYQIAQKYKNAWAGNGFHSLRAIDLAEIKTFFAEHSEGQIIHLHIAEQLKEVRDCKAYSGQRPVEYLFNHLPVNEYFHLIHATHLSQAETRAIARSGANVVLCPSTEGNLGDGFFNLKTFQKHKGNWSIGTDSHIGLNPYEELRFSDYRQRLKSYQRNAYTTKDVQDSGQYALQQAIFNGRKAVGNYESQNYFEIGKALDAVIIDANMPLLPCTSTENLLSTIIYSGDVSWNLGTMVNGEWKVKDQKHFQKEEIARKFQKAMKELANR